jgi:hypothetical protein
MISIIRNRNKPPCTSTAPRPARGAGLSRGPDLPHAAAGAACRRAARPRAPRPAGLQCRLPGCGPLTNGHPACGPARGPSPSRGHRVTVLRILVRMPSSSKPRTSGDCRRPRTPRVGAAAVCQPRLPRPPMTLVCPRAGPDSDLAGPRRVGVRVERRSSRSRRSQRLAPPFDDFTIARSCICMHYKPGMHMP